MIKLVQFVDVWLDVGGIDEHAQCHLEERHEAMLQIENNSTSWFFSSLIVFVVLLLGAVTHIAVGGFGHKFSTVVFCVFGVAVGSGFVLYRRGVRKTKLLAAMLTYCLIEHQNGYCEALISRRMMRSKVLARSVDKAMLR